MDEGTSARAARALIAGGYDKQRVAVLVGGIRAWDQAGYPLEKWTDRA
jgi:rhodanese-related sulfurtransferase